MRTPVLRREYRFLASVLTGTSTPRQFGRQLITALVLAVAALSRCILRLRLLREVCSPLPELPFALAHPPVAHRPARTGVGLDPVPSIPICTGFTGPASRTSCTIRRDISAETFPQKRRRTPGQVKLSRLPQGPATRQVVRRQNPGVTSSFNGMTIWRDENVANARAQINTPVSTRPERAWRCTAAQVCSLTGVEIAGFEITSTRPPAAH